MRSILEENMNTNKSFFERNGGTYIQVGDYLLPNLTIDESEQQPIGKYGRMRKEWLLWDPRYKGLDDFIWQYQLQSQRTWRHRAEPNSSARFFCRISRLRSWPRAGCSCASGSVCFLLQQPAATRRSGLQKPSSVQNWTGLSLMVVFLSTFPWQIQFGVVLTVSGFSILY